MGFAIHLAEQNWLPDLWIRTGIRRLLRQRLGSMRTRSQIGSFLETMRSGPIALATDEANQQHYEVPAAFFERALGPHLKYSCAWFDPDVRDLGQAEARMLTLTCERAEIQDGMSILELGCGWGSLSLWMASHFPHSAITAVSNSHSQREFILEKAGQRGLSNLEVLVSDMNDFQIDTRFDRIVSVEMFEHMRNHELLLSRVANWLKSCGAFFMHIFTHRSHAYFFQTQGDDNWLGRYFFTGGMMPSHELPFQLNTPLAVVKDWKVNGCHYQRTAEAWLANMDRHRDEIMTIFAETYGANEASIWFQRWRIFFMACAELWGFADGKEWQVSHYLMKPETVGR